ncbi:hypothetical protein M011DRAFT_485516 [Sporormia fimetaria CBS 119925]|uniref:DUF6697 domain-containing protein n=1 Tax=Sporormia fimetaria CBS 119925 TaxID=1340428 RepID=A0A6A6VGD3_9PLEO|nr:hypothetical protein M011DRAFT_485516 [Sporormia fimetaria CBS 119925]
MMQSIKRSQEQEPRNFFIASHARKLHPEATSFSPAGTTVRTNSSHAGSPTQPGFLERVISLEHRQDTTDGQLEHIRDVQASMARTLSELMAAGGLVTPENEMLYKFQAPLPHSEQRSSDAAAQSEKGDMTPAPHLKVPARTATTGTASLEKANAVPDPKCDAVTVGVKTGTTSLPPHLRKINSNGVTGKADTQPNAISVRPAPESTPPPESCGSIDPDVPLPSVEDPYLVRSSQGWVPTAILSFPPLPSDELSSIPPLTETRTFSFDYLKQEFGGTFWSPGLKYIPPSAGVCFLPTRSYYVLDATVEPYLPRAPGQHGAKLTAFFNSNPAEVYGPEAECSFENVPMFVCCTPWSQGKDRRYVYFGNYSQTRWSDKLDYDRLVEHVPHNVKQYWAKELSAVGRAEWVTEALKNHFFPKPAYEGLMPLTRGEDSEEDVEKREKKVERDVREYVEILKEWDKDAILRTKLIKEDFILGAFERADADDPPALRLWWEYLQCVKYDHRFYNTLVTLQERYDKGGARY